LIVVDTSVAVQWVVDEDTSSQSEALLSRSDLAAPDLLLIEAANALYRKVFVGDVSQEQAVAGLEFIRDKLELLSVPVPMLGRAIAMANERNHAVYDCAYLAIAEANSTSAFTRDRDLRRMARSHGLGHLVSEPPLAQP
jgi:predicted nucleic acid-binding protein